MNKEKDKIEEVSASNEELEISETTGTPISGHPDYDPDLPDNKQRDLR